MDNVATNTQSDSNGRTRAIVHVPREVSPMHAEASGDEKPSRITPLSDHRTEQYHQYSRTYIPEIPAIVLDIER